jgi:hypothetical protein
LIGKFKGFISDSEGLIHTLITRKVKNSLLSCFHKETQSINQNKKDKNNPITKKIKIKHSLKIKHHGQKTDQ